MTPATLIAMLDGWMREAVARHGDDWPAIMVVLEQNLDRLGEQQRVELSSQIALLLAASSGSANAEFH
jgi:hypothetical protein